ncbi:hypothetical protein DPMN_118746 [Dreissena polymorpha]|uniref:Uncharacterized protein n=1 Tax=Dreissena polymorpha TaxID=45954 RepID=A0A9D4GKQ1_DREPO|nr:hypothetical protein DPMN_118746 [Dreissena polymorpha]
MEYSSLSKSSVSISPSSGPDNVNKDISIYIPLDDDPLYSSVKQRPPNCTDRGACGFSADGFVKSEKKISGDLQYRCYGEFEDKTVLSVLNHDAELYSLAKNVDPMYSTVNKKTQNRLNVTLVNALDVNRADPLYSVVDKRDKIGSEAVDWDRQVSTKTVPSPPDFPSLVVPPYSKINKKNKKAADKATENRS